MSLPLRAAPPTAIKLTGCRRLPRGPGCRSLTTSQRYVRPDHQAITDAGEALSVFLTAG
jgi:hypothetical protein